MTVPNIEDTQLLITSTLKGTFNDKEMIDLLGEVFHRWEDLPEEVTDGGNDKRFFSLNYKGEKIFTVYEEPYSPETHATDHSKPATYTVMLASDY
jgi:hypothetical protein